VTAASIREDPSRPGPVLERPGSMKRERDRGSGRRGTSCANRGREHAELAGAICRKSDAKTCQTMRPQEAGLPM